MPTTTDVDRHRIACECYEGPRGKFRSDFRLALKKRLADFEDRDEALVHCLAMFDSWASGSVETPSSLTQVISRDAVVIDSQAVRPDSDQKPIIDQRPRRPKKSRPEPTQAAAPSVAIKLPDPPAVVVEQVATPTSEEA